MILSKAKRAFIFEEYQDSDGYWISLKPGFRIPGDSHGITENTRREAYAKLADVVPCSCAQCQQELARAAPCTCMRNTPPDQWHAKSCARRLVPTKAA
jgi:hypothetical protein